MRHGRRGLALATLGVALLAVLGGARVGRAQTPQPLSFSRPSVPAKFEKLDSRLRTVAASRQDDGLMAARATARAQALQPTSRGLIVIVEPAAGAGAAEDAVEAAGG